MRVTRRGLTLPPLRRTGKRAATTGSALGDVQPIAVDGRGGRALALLNLGSVERPSVIAVCSALGSVGKSTIAAGLAKVLSQSATSAAGAAGTGRGGRSERAVCLLDLDTFAPSQAILHARPQVTAGVLGSARLIRQERYSDGEHERLVAQAGSYDLLTGIASLERWPELDEYSIGVLLHDQSARYQQVVIDLGGNPSAAEVDPELGMRRNQATVKALAMADVVLLVTAADPVALSRTLGMLSAMRASAAGRIVVVVNRWRTSVIGSGALGQVLELLGNAGVDRDDVCVVPDDPSACDLALSRGVSVVEARGRGQVARALRELAAQINSSHVHSSRAGQAERQG